MRGGSGIIHRMPGPTTRLFVYGTLKRGDVRADLLEGQTFIRQTTTAPHYRLFNTGSYPALIEAGPVRLGGLSIAGELWQVDHACLARLDEEEGVEEGLYARRQITLADATTADSYFYLLSVTGMGDLGIAW